MGRTELGIALVGACLLLAGCGSDRSPEAYCRSFYEKAAPIRESYVEAGKDVEGNPLAAIVALFSAPGDLASIFDGMIDHAPDEIRSDTVIVRDSFNEMRESMGDAVDSPLKAIGKGLVNSLTSAGAFQRVDTYLTQHCPVDSELAQEYIKGG